MARFVWLCCAVLAIGWHTHTPQELRVQTYRLPMRDGVRLATDVYLPASKPPYPTILIRTPYDKNTLKPIGEDGARRGYAVVIQDTRGRFASEGANLPFEGDGWWEHRADGIDTLNRHARVNAPAVHIGGYYDIFAQGTIDAFVGYQTRGGRGARQTETTDGTVGARHPAEKSR
ncbi:MAG: CocE/NonD family hydrolase [Fimbriimonadales bacterium]|nr:CocE/NonD family hydrolase [Fimbriimonadales bacterium]